MPESAKRALPSRMTSAATWRSSLLSISATATLLHAAVLPRGADRQRELAQAALEQDGVRAESDDADGQRGGKHGRERMGRRGPRVGAKERRGASGRIVGESRGGVNRRRSRFLLRAVTTPAPRYAAAALRRFRAHPPRPRGPARRHGARRRGHPRRRRPARPHDARPRAARALSRGDRARVDGEGGRARDRQRAGRGADVGRPPAAGPVAHAARARHGVDDGRDARDGNRRDPALAPHRLPRRLPDPRRGARRGRPRAELGPAARRGRAPRRHHADHDAQSDRRRDSDVGRSRS